MAEERATPSTPPPQDNHAADTNTAPVSLYQKGDISRALQGNSDQRQAMSGFDAEFSDIVNYIIAITHRIWEEKAIGSIYHYYLHNAVIHMSSGDVYGREQVVANTIQALAAFPDRRLYGDDVIWSRTDDGVYYSSHRITHEGRNTGHSAYGPPTGRKIRYRAIADCIVKENQVIEEWLVRDELSLVTQLGFDPHQLARSMAQAEARYDAGRKLTPAGEIERLRGQLPPEAPVTVSPDDDLHGWIESLFHEVWNWRMLNRVDAYFDVHLHAESASGRSLHGLGAYKGYILSLMSPFPDLAISVDHICVIADMDASYRVATRWSLQGTHTGPGIYGAATGKRVFAFGVTHHLIQHGKIVREWTLFDEFAILKQLYAPD